MATIEKLNSISASKAAIKAAIQEKGVSCDDTLAEYANRIKAIPTGLELKTVRIAVNMSQLDIYKNENAVFELAFEFQVHNEATNTWQPIPDNFAYESAILDEDNFLSDIKQFTYNDEAIFENLDGLSNLVIITKDHTVAIIQYEGTFGDGEMSGVIWKIPTILSFSGLKKLYGQTF